MSRHPAARRPNHKGQPVIDGLVNVPISGTIFGGGITLFRKDVKYETRITINHPLGPVRDLQVQPTPGPSRTETEEHPSPREPSEPRRPEAESAPCTIETTLVFDDPSIKEPDQFDQFELGEVKLVVLRKHAQEVAMRPQPRFVVERRGAGLIVTNHNGWRSLDQRVPCKPLREFPPGSETRLPGARATAQFWRGRDRSLTLYRCPLNQQVVLGGQRCRFSSDVIHRVYLAAIRKHDVKTYVRGVAVLVIPETKEY